MDTPYSLSLESNANWTDLILQVCSDPKFINARKKEMSSQQSIPVRNVEGHRI